MKAQKHVGINATRQVVVDKVPTPYFEGIKIKAQVRTSYRFLCVCNVAHVLFLITEFERTAFENEVY